MRNDSYFNLTYEAVNGEVDMDFFMKFDEEEQDEYFDTRRKNWIKHLQNAGFEDHRDYFKWRRQIIFEQREAGEKYKSIAEDHNISVSRAAQVYRQGQRRFLDPDQLSHLGIAPHRDGWGG